MTGKAVAAVLLTLRVRLWCRLGLTQSVRSTRLPHVFDAADAGVKSLATAENQVAVGKGAKVF